MQAAGHQPRRRRGRSSAELQEAIDLLDTPDHYEAKTTSSKRREKRRKLKATRQAQQAVGFVPPAPQDERAVDAASGDEADVGSFVDLEESKQAHDDPDFVGIEPAREEAQRLDEQRRLHITRPSTTRQERRRNRRLVMTDDELASDRQRLAQAERDRRANMAAEAHIREGQGPRGENPTATLPANGDNREGLHPGDEERWPQLPRARTTTKTRLYRVALMNQQDFDSSKVVGKYVVDGRHRLPDPTVVCSKCGAWKWVDETAFTCCRFGKVVLPQLLPAPAFLLDLMRDKIHRPNLRPYNMSVAFTSIGASVNNGQFERVAENRAIQGQRGVYTLSIQGAVHHFLGSLLPHVDQATGLPTEPRFAQIYVVELNKAGRAERRMSLFDGLDGVVLLQLGDMLEEHNPFVRVFMTMGERLREMSLGGEPPLNVAFQLEVRKEVDPRRFNIPTMTEVSALMVEDGNGGNHRDLLLFPRRGGLLRLFETQEIYDPLQYPLLFPYGEPGWHHEQEYADNAKFRNKRTMALREFVAYRLHQKMDDQSALHQGGRLFQQYVVDQWAKIEQGRLRWVANNQQTIRADQYKGFRDALLNEGVIELGANEGLVSTYDRHTEQLVHPRADQSAQGIDNSAVPTTAGTVPGGNFLDQVGQRVILPASFTGGERYMYEQYQDAMAMVREFGKPDLFMTMTCNPKWEEITITIEKYGGPDQSAQDRPDIVARVWQQKLKALLKDLDDGVLGHQVARIYVIEFQKRGLPHAHILIILGADDKPRTRSDFDKFVSAEIPDRLANPALFETVMTTMIHGPCGDKNPNSPCMKDKVCTKGFPKPFSDVTEINEDGFPKHRRRAIAAPFVFKNKRYDVDINQWVVGYNPFFSQKYNCHTNLEVCSTIVAVKYLYKYVYKGPDMAEIRTEAVHTNARGIQAPRREPNEIVRYVKARSISPMEACLRILEAPIQGKTHTVVMLEVHIPDGQMTTFRSTDDPETVLDRSRHSKLTRFFELAASDEEARQTLYKDIPKRFRWDVKERQWYRYKNQRRAIGRLVHCSLTDQQRHFVRVLLCHRPGPTSFEDLRTVNGHLCATFKEAALRAGYLESDEEWISCLREAALFQMPYQLCQLFATILLYCVPANSRELWDQFYGELSGDFEYSLRNRNLVNKDDLVKFKTLKRLHDLLAAGSKSLADFDDLPQLSDFPDLMHASFMDNALIRRELEGYSISELQNVVDDVGRLNVDQRATYDKIIAAVDNGQPGNKLFFIDGPGGTGKSTLLNHVLAKVRAEGKIAIAVASSGIAALLLPGGRTAHSTFKIPIKLNDRSTCFIKKQGHLKQLIEQASLIVWDEAPMTHRHAFEALDRTLKDLLDNSEPFGGKVVVLSGDFRQTLPVVKKGSREDTVRASLSKSVLWPHFTKMRLTVNMRVMGAANVETAAELQSFSEYLLRIGDGLHDRGDLPEQYIKIPRDMVVDTPVCDPVSDRGVQDEQPVAIGLKRIVDFMYKDEELNNTAIATDEYFASRTILTPTNAAVQSINEAVAKRLNGVTQVYLSRDSIDDDTGEGAAFYETELLNELNPNGIPPHRLLLKTGTPVMMIRNLNPADGLCNGTRLRVVELKDHVIRATIMTGSHDGKEVLIPRIIFISSDDIKNFPFRLRRVQFPVVPAFAMTINKAQGQTVKNMGLYLPTPCFSHGQLYVALSRVTAKNKLKIMVEKPEEENDEAVYTNNIVYREIFT